MANIDTFINNLISAQKSFAYGLAQKVFDIAVKASDLGSRDLDEDLLDKFILPNVNFIDEPVDHKFLTLPPLNLDISDIEEIELERPDIDELNTAVLEKMRAFPKLRPIKYTDYSKYLSSIPSFKEKPPNIDFSDLEALLGEFPNHPVPQKPNLIEFGIEDLPEPPDIPDTFGTRTLFPVFKGTIPENTAQQFLDAFQDQFNGNLTAIKGHLNAILKKFFPNEATQQGLLDNYIDKFMRGELTAWSDLVEEQIYTRVKNRNSLLYLREYEEALNTAAESGNPVMPLRVQAQLFRVGEASAARETEAIIAVAEQRKQVELEQFKFCLTMVYNLKQLALSTRNDEFKNLTQLIQVSATIAGEYVEHLYKVCDRYLELYKADIQAAELEIRDLERLRGDALAKVEIYTGQLRGLELIEAINGRRINAYGVEAEVYATLYRAYDSRVKAILGMAEIRKLPLEQFLAMIQAFEAEVRAAEARNNLIESLIKADLSIIQLNLGEITAWTAELDARIKELSLVETKFDNINKFNTTLVTYFTAQIEFERLKKLLQRDDIDLASLLNQQNLAQFSSKTQKAIETMRSRNDFNLKREGLFSQYSNEYQQLVLKLQELLIIRDKASAEILLAGAGPFGDLSASAMNGLNALLELTETIVTQG